MGGGVNSKEGGYRCDPEWFLWLRSVTVSVSDFRRNEPGSMPVPYYMHSSGYPMSPCKTCGEMSAN